MNSHNKLDIVEEARNVFEAEIKELYKVKAGLNSDFEALVSLILNARGRVIITGMGKSGYIGRKISSTLSSLGVPSYYLHPSEAVHGDLGIIRQEDILISISKSGETEELLQLLPAIKKIGVKLVSITSYGNSTLGQNSDLNIVINVIDEACSMNLAPTSSTTATLVLGDALAIVLSKINGITKERFALYHPQGSLGKSLLIKVSDVMSTGDNSPVVKSHTKVKDAIFQITGKGLGAVNVIDNQDKLIGILTDGDIRRNLENYNNILEVDVETIMTHSPIVIAPDKLAIEALNYMQDRPRTLMVMPVVDNEGHCIGMLSLSAITKAGIV